MAKQRLARRPRRHRSAASGRHGLRRRAHYIFACGPLPSRWPNLLPLSRLDTYVHCRILLPSAHTFRSTAGRSDDVYTQWIAHARARARVCVVCERERGAGGGGVRDFRMRAPSRVKCAVSVGCFLVVRAFVTIRVCVRARARACGRMHDTIYVTVCRAVCACVDRRTGSWKESRHEARQEFSGAPVIEVLPLTELSRDERA